MIQKITTFLKLPFNKKNHTDEDFLTELLKDEFNQKRLDNIFERCKINLNWKDTQGDSMLHICARKNNANAVNWLCKNGADMYQVNLKHLTPLQVAAYSNKKYAALALLNKGFDINTPDKYNRTLFQDLVLNCSPAVIEILIPKVTNASNIDNQGRNVLFDAVSNGSPEIISMISKIRDVQKDLIASNGNTIMHQQTVLNNPQIALVLMENKVDPMRPDRKGKGFLYYALALGADGIPHFKNAKKLKFNLNQKLENGSNLIHILISFISSQKEPQKIESLMKLFIELLKLGVDYNCADNNGITPLMLACKQGNNSIVSILTKLKMIEINAQDNNGKTALMHAACVPGGVLCVNTLLTFNANQEIETKEKKTAIFFAIEAKNNTETVKSLLKNAANITRVDTKDRNIMHTLSLSSGDISYFKMLNICNPKLINKIDLYGYYPIEYAIFKGNFELAKLMLEFGAKNEPAKKDFKVFENELVLNDCQNSVISASHNIHLKNLAEEITQYLPI